MEKETYYKSISSWLLLGAVMVIVQVLLGGITRLTGSGLSITEWKVIMGWIPPMNELQWQEAFDKYKQFPQFHLLNEDMTLSGFKSIFLWEYLHRVWARLIGIVFLIPFIVFLVRRQLSATRLNEFMALFALGALQGLVGWLMVSTGLKDRAWVTPFSLSMHLLLALFTFSIIYWTYLSYNKLPRGLSLSVTWINSLLVLTSIQILFGGLMAGSHAALNFNTWPSMNNQFLPEGWWNSDIAFYKNFVENNTWIQVIHRNTAYLVTLLILLFWWKNRQQKNALELSLLPFAILLQAGLGITTIMLSVGKIPIFWAVAHQVCAVFLITLLIRLRYKAGAAS
jgi:cytochrome c oxidase assembly protein subunit 15